MHDRDAKRIHVLQPEDPNKEFSEGIKQLKDDALNTTKKREVKI